MNILNRHPEVVNEGDIYWHFYEGTGGDPVRVVSIHHPKQIMCQKLTGEFVITAPSSLYVTPLALVHGIMDHIDAMIGKATLVGASSKDYGPSVQQAIQSSLSKYFDTKDDE